MRGCIFMESTNLFADKLFDVCFIYFTEDKFCQEIISYPLLLMEGTFSFSFTHYIINKVLCDDKGINAICV